MSGRLLARIGTATETASFVGARVETGSGAGAEITVEETNNRLVAHDGVTPGGHPAARLDEVVTIAAFGAQMLTWFNSLPTSLPGSSGELWNNGGTLAKS